MTTQAHSVQTVATVRGKRVELPAVELCGATVVTRGRLLRIAEIFDEYWVERDYLPLPTNVIDQLRTSPARPDLFTFGQRVPDANPRFDYHYELDNYAVLPLTTYEHWFEKQIPAATRRAIRASEKRGIEVRVSSFDDAYVQGIKAIYDETPTRAGRRFWHFGKDLQTVALENGTYAARSTFLAADYQGEMVGYLKVVWDRHTAAIMQILSRTAVREFRPNNALLAAAVQQCSSRGISYLLYERFDYGKKTGDSLTRFKQNNGFIRMDVPRYWVPLTAKGAVALQLGMHRNASDWVPEWMASRIRALRSGWYDRKAVEK